MLASPLEEFDGYFSCNTAVELHGGVCFALHYREPGVRTLLEQFSGVTSEWRALVDEKGALLAEGEIVENIVSSELLPTIGVLFGSGKLLVVSFGDGITMIVPQLVQSDETNVLHEMVLIF